MEIKVNLTAILVLVVVNLILAFAWYMPLFGKAWGNEMGYDPDMKPDKSVMLRGMLFMIIGNFFFAWVLAHNIAAWSFVPGANEMNPLTSGLSAAIFTWLGFYFPGELTATVWQKHSWKLFGINTGYQLLSLFVAALILTHWR
jgi:hypothetical protein